MENQNKIKNLSRRNFLKVGLIGLVSAGCQEANVKPIKPTIYKKVTS